MAAASVPALERGLTILELVTQTDGGMGFSEIIERTSVPKATVARVLAVLRDRGYVVKDGETGYYRPGPRMALLSSDALHADRLLAVGAPVLRECMQETCNTVLLFGWNGRQFESLAKEMHPSSIVMQTIGGLGSDFSNTPWGWLFFADLTEELQKAAVATMADPAAFTRIYAERHAFYRKHGFMFDYDCMHRGVRRLAAPIRHASGQMAGALGLGGHETVLDDANALRLGQLLISHAGRISASLGWHP